MDIKAWLEDRKNLPIIAAGTGIIIILALLFVLKSSGVIGKKQPNFSAQEYSMPADTTGIPATPAPGTEGTVPPAGTPPVPTEPGMPTAAPPPSPGTPTAVETTSGAQSQTPSDQAKLAPMLPYRKDPFQTTAGKPNVKHALMSVLPQINPPRLAASPIVTGPDMSEVMETTAPQPFRRMAGAMWNGKVAAILETEGESDIVRPGMEITRGGSRVRVESIQPNYIILKTLDTRTPITIKVNMAGSVTNTGTGATPSRPGYNMPGSPPGFSENMIRGAGGT